MQMLRPDLKHLALPRPAKRTLPGSIGHDHQVVAIGEQAVDVALHCSASGSGAHGHLSVSLHRPAPTTLVDEPCDALGGKLVEALLHALLKGVSPEQHERSILADDPPVGIINRPKDSSVSGLEVTKRLLGQKLDSA